MPRPTQALEGLSGGVGTPSQKSGGSIGGETSGGAGINFFTSGLRIASASSF